MTADFRRQSVSFKFDGSTATGSTISQHAGGYDRQCDSRSGRGFSAVEVHRSFLSVVDGSTIPFAAGSGSLGNVVYQCPITFEHAVRC